MFSVAIGCARRHRSFRPRPAEASTPSLGPHVTNKFHPAALVQAILLRHIRASFCVISTGRFAMTHPQDVTSLQSQMSAAVHEHWKAFLIEGVLLVILVLGAMIVPPLASLAVTIV